METFSIEKSVWDDSDFNSMGWHDATIWSLVADPEHFEFILDIDYIFKWVPPLPHEKLYRFWVSPVTMVFEHVHSISISIDSQLGRVDIADLHRGSSELTPNKRMSQRKYRFECQEGEISLVSTGYKMFVRKAPEMIGTSQSFTLSQRGGIDFARKKFER